MKLILKISLLTITFFNMNLAMAKKIITQEVTYNSGIEQCKGMVSYDEELTGKLTAILVVPEWWGCNEYTRRRAKELAELGYFAMAVDMYGEGKTASNPGAAQELATPFYKNPKMGLERINAAIEKVKSYSNVDADNIGAIGYCFGGSMVLNAAKLGVAFKGVVSFHGGLAGVPAEKGVLKSKILVCHGDSDKFVSEEDIKNFRSNLDEVKAQYTFLVYENATHAFTNPDATETGKKFNIPIAYNENADKKSWKDMVQFFQETFK
jgi:dienelactone hydrolase